MIPVIRGNQTRNIPRLLQGKSSLGKGLHIGGILAQIADGIRLCGGIIGVFLHHFVKIGAILFQRIQYALRLFLDIGQRSLFRFLCALGIALVLQGGDGFGILFVEGN